MADISKCYPSLLKWANMVWCYGTNVNGYGKWGKVWKVCVYGVMIANEEWCNGNEELACGKMNQK